MTSPLSSQVLQFVSRCVGTTAFECFQLAGDASTRKYYRIGFDNQSRVLMSWEPFTDPASYPFLNVQTHFARMDVRVPKVEAFAPELGVVLLEDLGDLTLERKFWENQNQELSLPFYRQAVDELIKIHFLASRPLQPPSVCQKIQFDTSKFMWEMNYAREHFLEKVGRIRLTDSDQKQLQSEFQLICETLDRQPKFVCHRDYHSRNLMLKLGRVYVIDFQDARLGPLQYDLVSLVHDSYVDLSPATIKTIKDDYLNKALQAGPSNAIRPDFEEIFHIQMIQRCFKACGSFASFYNMRNDTRYLKHIRGTATLVGDALKADHRFKLFSRILNESGLLGIKFEELCAP
ncbi:MAG: aminoglycoside phosphotransferase family protein [Bdellovibrionales bacterium]